MTGVQTCALPIYVALCADRIDAVIHVGFIAVVDAKTFVKIVRRRRNSSKFLALLRLSRFIVRTGRSHLLRRCLLRAGDPPKKFIALPLRRNLSMNRFNR